MHNFKELEIWQKSRALVKSVYDFSSTIPKEELYGLTTQIRRSAVSIPSNIAEGAGKDSTKDFIRFLEIANGSAFELETQIFLCFDLGYTDEIVFNDLTKKIQEVQKMIFSFKQKVKERLTLEA